MNKGGRPKAPLILSDDERQKLETWAVRPKSTQRLATRARIVLACAEGLDNKDVAARLRVNTVTVGKWRKRFLADRLEGLADEPRPVPRARSPTRWSRGSSPRPWRRSPRPPPTGAPAAWPRPSGCPRRAIVRVWSAFGLKPHKAETFKLSTDPYFVEKVRDVVGLYMSPPENAIVLSVDEKSQVQALDRTQPLLPMTPGQAERGTPDYVRNGTTSLFAALNVATGAGDRQVLPAAPAAGVPQVPQRDRRPGRRGSRASRSTSILDNYGTHKTPSGEAVVRASSRVSPPFHADQRVVAEPGGAVLRARSPRSGSVAGSFRSVPALEKAIMEYLADHNENPRPFVWTANADLILERVKRVCERISNSGH